MQYNGVTAIRKEVADTENEQNPVTRQRVLEELSCIAFSRATDYIRVEDGHAQVQNTDELSDQAARAIVSIKEGTKGVEIKLGDKMRALELLGRSVGLFEKEPEEPTGLLPVEIVDDV